MARVINMKNVLQWLLPLYAFRRLRVNIEREKNLKFKKKKKCHTYVQYYCYYTFVDRVIGIIMRDFSYRPTDGKSRINRFYRIKLYGDTRLDRHSIRMKYNVVLFSCTRVLQGF